MAHLSTIQSSSIHNLQSSLFSKLPSLQNMCVSLHPIFLCAIHASHSNLGYNKLTNLPFDLFAPLERLQLLNLTGNAIQLLPRDIFAYNSVFFRSGWSPPVAMLSNCTQAGGVQSPSVLGRSFCSMTDAVGHVIDGFASFVCQPIHDRLQLPPHSFATITLASTTTCQSVTSLILPASKIVDVSPQFFDGLPNLKNVDLSNNPLKTIPDSVRVVHHLGATNTHRCCRCYLDCRP